MNSKKSMLLIVALAVLGGIVFSQVDISPAITFILGVLASAFVVNFSSTDSKSDSEPKASTKTLYVGNLPYKANESHVRELFSEHGEVFAVRLMKDKRTGKRRGFGFVVMASNDVNHAISELNDKDYMQRTLKVRVANDPKHPEADEAELS
ncbi:RNA recognition motif domain-containing protein [Vibrio cyclitrophicus]|uniref:RNA recognition motif domain-containing protein n=1 Tax=Vibrio cyclitrophicus TaxID=47951 RepID=UPI0002DE4555|nr:RNA-binding protein [Vibrio cyclitrophicus]OEE82880.1 RNA-binding protein [Vibrio cyclitrophicus FF160]PME25577.1 RNA-binding protein [Vibrio cyclitrophicus]PME89711.1 RNA-binding protein [Vibrio cyclitrophicus]PMF55457.1 RNA-binding protein [Vibrio cyclitrophicus]PMF60393.1 RNA-binding protein [Vibrio cyclitrophicus]